MYHEIYNQTFYVQEKHVYRTSENQIKEQRRKPGAV
jgi:hypothetical protein